MNILCLTHADFETPGVIEDWAKLHKHTFHICKPYKGQHCLKTTDFDFLIVMGGPQSPLKLKEAPFLKDEISIIQNAIQKNKLVLGFCLGAQLIGEALDTKTERSPEKEVGVFPITLTKEGTQDPLFKGFPNRFLATHWHNDMPGETKNSVLLASSQGCPKQVIRYAPHVYGFQCHLEINTAGIQEMIHACPNDLSSGPFTQTKEVLLSQDYTIINQMMFTILDRLVLI